MSLPLEIVVTGDTNDAKSALTDLQTQVGATVVAINKAGTSFDNLSSQLALFKTAASSTLNPELLTIYNGKVVELETQLRNLALAQQQETKAAQDSAIAFEEMTVASNNTSAGATRFQAAITRATDPLSVAAREVNNLSRRFISLASLFVITEIPAAIAGIIDYISSLNKTGDAAQQTAANLSALNDVMDDANKKAGEQTADLNILYQTATDVTLSTKDRTAAVLELQKTFPDYFKNISQETILNGGAKAQYELLTASILKNAEAKASLNKIEELYAQKLDVSFEKQKVLAAQANELAKAQADVGNATQIVGGLAPTAASQGTTLQQAKDIINNRIDLKLALLKNNDDIIQGQIDFLTKFATLPSLANVIESQDKAAKAKIQKGDDPYTISLQDLEDNYKDAQALDEGVKDLLLQDEKDFLQKKLALNIQYGKYLGAVNDDIAKNAEAIAKAQIEFIASQHIDDLTNKIPAYLDPSKLADAKIDPKAKDHVLELTAALKEYGLQLQKVDAQSLTYADFLNKEFGPAFEQLFSTIISGSGNAFAQFAKALEQILIQLAATILKAAALAAIITLIFPGAAGGKSFSDIFNAILGKGIPKFAGGVQNFGGGAAWVGENGPELVTLPSGASVIPGNQIGSGSIQPMIFIADSTIHGANIVLSYNRQTGINSRNG
jgi:hypothetical protein